MNTQKSENLAEVSISYRSKVKASDRPKISKSSDAFDLLKSIYNDDTVEHHEETVILLVNRALQVLGWAKIGMGGINSTIVDPRIIFQHALLANATGIFLSHNHPSGLTKPSEEDRKLTKALVEGGKLLDIQLLDHIIYTRDGYFSFADEAEL